MLTRRKVRPRPTKKHGCRLTRRPPRATKRRERRCSRCGSPKHDKRKCVL